ncbi:potassium transporter [Flavobacterium arcticum]|uniref:Potassium transporter n=1 Tax=Flavobacterium arcticum TaxID=1784713 RepID=A0A345HAZ9_9FLAO|nr:potassium transporter TrkG [Flavobacterium arcticum]AXG73759.1 potassium transporter [Flavobacterium arcticum]KAF2511711.1 potassium transporter [Flavobacterium arcticum]
MFKNISNVLSKIYGFVDILLITFLVFDFGFENLISELFNHKTLYLIGLIAGLITFNVIRFFYTQNLMLKKMLKANVLILALTLVIATVTFLFSDEYERLYKATLIIDTGLILYFFLRLTSLIRKLYALYYNPTILFVGSFAITGFIGAFLLMLPNATTHGITFTDALFTSISAVCVTGLIVVDTAADFTFMGKTVILCLIQLGGIGMLTFTSFFSFFFKQGSTFREGMNVSSFVDSDNLQNVMRFAMRVVAFTVGIEIAGALLIYSFIADIPSIEHKAFFSIFHSISAFCNAGFSTFSAGLADPSVQNAYAFQWVIMHLIIFGGLGYNIVFNFLLYIKHFIVNSISNMRFQAPVRILTLNSRIVIITTATLLTVGSIFFFFAEQSNAFSKETFFGKITSAAFTSVTARTAGFNTFDFASLSMPAILFVIFLMWIGASPGSTGGGIKTSTFALATLNVFTIARGKEHIELRGRKINNQSVKRAFAIICISLIVIGMGILMILFFEKDFSLIQIAFEVFSAFSTVGLSLGITASLSIGSKYVLIVVMFLGRIGLLNLLIGMLKTIEAHSYEYPEENILIN